MNKRNKARMNTWEATSGIFGEQPITRIKHPWRARTMASRAHG